MRLGQGGHGSGRGRVAAPRGRPVELLLGVDEHQEAPPQHAGQMDMIRLRRRAIDSSLAGPRVHGSARDVGVGRLPHDR